MHRLSSNPPDLYLIISILKQMLSMNTLVHSLVLILMLIVSSPYDQLSCMVLAEARRISNSNGVLTMELIHRDSLMSHKKHQKRSHFSSKRSHRAHLPSVTKKAGSNTAESEIFPDTVGPEYLIKLAIGTPPVEFLAVADTGSNLIWLQCAGCQKTHTCVAQTVPIFDPSKSSTFRNISCTSHSCIQSGIHSGCIGTDKTQPCGYNQLYVDNTFSNGILSTDTITFPSVDNASAAPSFQLPSTIFGCGFNQSGNFSNVGSIVGLGTGPTSLVSQLGKDRFSYCLVPRSSGATSKIKFGADVTTPGALSIPFVTTNIHAYFITLDTLSVGNNSFTIGLDVAFDSGSTVISLETSIYNSIKHVVQNSIVLEPLSGLDVDPMLCYETRESLNLPNVVFHFKDADIMLNSDNLLWDPGDGIQCLAMLPTDGPNIFGKIAQINFEVGYNLHAQQIIVAPADCTTF